MPIPDQAVVRETLAKHGRDVAIYKAMDTGWDIVRKRFPDQARWRRKSTRAGLVWEYGVDSLIESMAGGPGVHIASHHDTVSFVFDDLVLVRLKKASVELQSSNYPTDLATAFHDHAADLFGFAGLHRVEATYVLNQIETTPIWIGIVAREGKSHLWNFELDSQGAVIEQLSLTPLGDEDAADSDASRIVRLSDVRERFRNEDRE